MFRILFALYLPLMLAPIPAAAAAKKTAPKPAAASPKQNTAKLADNYDADLTYTLEIKVKNISSKKKSR